MVPGRTIVSPLTQILLLTGVRRDMPDNYAVSAADPEGLPVYRLLFTVQLNGNGTWVSGEHGPHLINVSEC